MDLLQGVILSPLKIIQHPKGNVLHALKQSDDNFQTFGEAYFSTIAKGEIKGWKKHRLMTLNLIVPVGAIKFVLFDGRNESSTSNQFSEIILSATDNYCRLTVPPLVWLAFQGVDDQLNLLLNIANIEHNPQEADNRPLEQIVYKW